MLVVINKNQRYDTYKNSELDWVKEVPEHWKRKKVFHFFKEFFKAGHKFDLRCVSRSGHTYGCIMHALGMVAQSCGVARVRSFSKSFSIVFQRRVISMARGV